MFTHYQINTAGWGNEVTKSDAIKAHDKKTKNDFGISIKHKRS